jgi:hypothetical protein
MEPDPTLANATLADTFGSVPELMAQDRKEWRRWDAGLFRGPGDPELKAELDQFVDQSVTDPWDRS